jgi:hypothetical protein
MVRPARFGFNAETAVSNRFQRKIPQSGLADLAARAVAEFDTLESALRSAGVETCVLHESTETACPDAVFPNNWISFHEDGTVVLYPMQAISRRRERRMAEVGELARSRGYGISRLVDLTHHELEGQFLEGTGSLVLDHRQRTAFACRSSRTSAAPLREFAARLEYEPFLFDAADRSGTPLYHTNVMLSIGEAFAIVCLESVAARDRGPLRERLESSGRHIIDIGFGQMESFAANVLQLRSGTGDLVLAMSRSAQQSFGAAALGRLEEHAGRIVAADVGTIESAGGGSVRCMLAENFLPRSAAP